MSDTTNYECAECGMPVTSDEYHPYAACLMFKACHNSETVKANLDAVLAQGRADMHDKVMEEWNKPPGQILRDGNGGWKHIKTRLEELK